MDPHSAEGEGEGATSAGVSATSTRSGPPPTRVSSVASDSVQQSGLQHHDFMFTDEASIAKGLRSLVKDAQARVLETLGEANTRKFNTVGFCQQRPVQILSPFQLPLGPLRRAWKTAFDEVRGKMKTFCYAYQYTC